MPDGIRDTLFGGLPLPEHNHLTLYVLGPGFGESQVLILPDRQCIVVDSCQFDGANLTRSLLDWLDVREVALLVVTHPDLDHVAGLPELVEGLNIRQVWRYRGGANVTSLASHWLRSFPGDHRLEEVHRAHQCLARIEDILDDVWEVGYQTKPWRTGTCEVHCLAPTQHDVSKFRRRLNEMVTGGAAGVELATWLREYLVGERSTLGEKGNPLSLALSVTWGESRVLLSGDVENGDGHQRSGWRGVLHYLERDGHSMLVRNLRVVKVAHHGSAQAFLSDAWAEHAQDASVEASVLTPFNRGENPPPHERTLVSLRKHSASLLVTAKDASKTGTKARNAGWTPDPASSPASAPCVAIVVDANGEVSACVGTPSERFTA
jgi:beta-lactamase superfamily II metal-dependent hydrolase